MFAAFACSRGGPVMRPTEHGNIRQPQVSVRYFNFLNHLRDY
jgi:hypothetical protein